jgi:hypothetical protein
MPRPLRPAEPPPLLLRRSRGEVQPRARRGSDRVARCGERAFQIELDLECGLVLDTVQYEQYCMKMVQRVRVTVRGFKESGPMEDLTKTK